MTVVLGRDFFYIFKLTEDIPVVKTKSGTKPDWELIQKGGKFILTASEISPYRVMPNADRTVF